jgi:uncharacterized protein GlcG (DUF336 family)
MKKTLLNFLTVIALSAGGALADHEARHKVLVLTNKAGAAIPGCDAVAYFTDNKPVKGGVPIMHHGQILGAIGVSGAKSAAQDEGVALAGTRAIEETKTARD